MAKKTKNKKETSVATAPTPVETITEDIQVPNFEMEPEEYTMIEKWQTVKSGEVAVRPYFDRTILMHYPMKVSISEYCHFHCQLHQRL